MNKEEYIQHTAILREAQLAAGQIGAGATSIGKANHAQSGYYHQAFFGLSIGIERLCKLIYIADHTISQSGKFPKYEAIKSLGHDLSRLLDTCEAVGVRLDPDRRYADRPNSAIHVEIVKTLSDFAITTRYHNINFLTNPLKAQQDPIAAWWNNVGIPICDAHNTPKARARDEAEAVFTCALLSEISTVSHTAETGDHIGDIENLVKRARATSVVQRYGRMYTL